MIHGPLFIFAVEFRVVKEFGAAILTGEQKPFLKLVVWSSRITPGDAKDVRGWNSRKLIKDVTHR